MIVHIFNDQKKFSINFFEMMRENDFSLKEHRLFHYGSYSPVFENLGVKTAFLKSWFLPFGHYKLLREMEKADAILIHSLASPLLLLILFFRKDLCHKCIWSIWGKDLYFFQLSENKTLFHHIYEFFRKKVISNISCAISAFSEEGRLLKEWYGFENKSILYGFIYVGSTDLNVVELKGVDYSCGVDILLGNSASRTNRHIDALTKLKQRESDINQIICPLSYGGDKKYVDAVVKKGQELFGDKFYPLLDFMPAEEYYDLISRVQFVIFNHNRQEALMNTFSMILKGKTIFMSPQSPTYHYFQRVGIQIKNIDNVGFDFEPQETESLKNNQKILLENIQVSNAVKLLKKIYSLNLKNSEKIVEQSRNPIE